MTLSEAKKYLTRDLECMKRPAEECFCNCEQCKYAVNAFQKIEALKLAIQLLKEKENKEDDLK